MWSTLVKIGSRSVRNFYSCLKKWPHLYPNSPLNGFLGFGNDPWHHRPTQQHLGRENKTFLHNHRDRSIHIERECCCGPALADIWQLLRQSPGMDLYSKSAATVHKF